MKKKIILMAKSFKRNNYCIAGIDFDNGTWIRLVSDDVNSEGAVLRGDTLYADGTEAEVLDIVEVELTEHVPTTAQSENWKYDRNVKWKKCGKSTLQEVINFRGLDNCGNNIFGNTEKKIAPADVNGQSLALIEVKSPYIVVKTFVKKNVSFCFTYNGYHYNFFSVSDIQVYQKYSHENDGTYRDFADPCYAVVSLTGEFSRDGLHYKMLAQLF